MKKIVLALLGPLFFFFPQVFADWAYITRQSDIQKNEVVFTNFISNDYDTYIFVFDMLEPLGGFEDIVIQASTDGGSTWIETYTGGATCINPRGAAMRPCLATEQGIPITNVQNQGYYFIGELRLSNVHNPAYPTSVKGVGLMGNQCHGTIYGTFGFATGINAIRFLSAKPAQHPKINRYDITVYGLEKN